MYTATDKLRDPYAAGIYRKMLKNELEYAENELCKHSSAYTLDASTGTVRSSIVLQTYNLGGPGYHKSAVPSHSTTSPLVYSSILSKSVTPYTPSVGLEQLEDFCACEGRLLKVTFEVLVSLLLVICLLCLFNVRRPQFQAAVPTQYYLPASIAP
ncbi:hypothetical protein C8R45DRAFT_926675 [Mycena sanguinolenta]|nr:hypothetical protein C8R45DRAFT_926675 [Mycena sanguinolenta]